MGKYDIALRHITRRHPEDLARALLPPGIVFEVVGWDDTQVTAVERRLDRALDLRVAGKRRALHVEIEADMDAADAYRVYSYNARLVMALCDEAAKAPSLPQPRLPPGTPAKLRAAVPVHSVVILLRGRKEPWPEQAAYATGWPEVSFCGAHLRVEAVYQRTVAELRARGGLLWLVFTPLATDASPAAMREVVDEIRGACPGGGGAGGSTGGALGDGGGRPLGAQSERGARGDDAGGRVGALHDEPDAAQSVR